MAQKTEKRVLSPGPWLDSAKNFRTSIKSVPGT